VERHLSLEELEEQTKTQTRRQEGKILTIIEGLLNRYSVCFEQIGQFQRTNDNTVELVWLFLTIRAFNSMRWAYCLLETGYYSQSMMLTRSAFEDWLVCEDCKTHPSTVNAILEEGKRVPNPKTMSDRLEEPLKQKWNDEIYGFLSTFTHPRYSGVAVLIDPETKFLRVGPAYEWKLVLVTSHYLLFALILMTEFLIRLVDPIEPSWWLETKTVVDQAQECRQEVFNRLTE
jgi:hypothetical protein